jgi:hypothetical protein
MAQSTVAAIETTWWEYTGRMTPFVDGISSAIMRKLGGDEERPSPGLPVGALWAARDSSAYEDCLGADGLAVFWLPGGHTWLIDGHSSNCPVPNETKHRCWVRHGTVGDKLTVDKAGLTCKAGAGSISVEGWHGYLRKGQLVIA